MLLICCRVTLEQKWVRNCTNPRQSRHLRPESKVSKGKRRNFLNFSIITTRSYFRHPLPSPGPCKMALRSYFISLRFVTLFSPPDSERLQRIGEECTFTAKFHLGNFKKVTETILILGMRSRHLKSRLMSRGPCISLHCFSPYKNFLVVIFWIFRMEKNFWQRAEQK